MIEKHNGGGTRDEGYLEVNVTRQPDLRMWS